MSYDKALADLLTQLEQHPAWQELIRARNYYILRLERYTRRLARATNNTPKKPTPPADGE